MRKIIILILSLFIISVVSAAPLSEDEVKESIAKTTTEYRNLKEDCTLLKTEIVDLRSEGYWLSTPPYNTIERDVSAIENDIIKADEELKKGNISKADLSILNAKVRIEYFKEQTSFGREIFKERSKELLKTKDTSTPEAKEVIDKLNDAERYYKNGGEIEIPPWNDNDRKSLIDAIKKYEEKNGYLQPASLFARDAYYEAGILPPKPTPQETTFIIYPSTFEVKSDDSVTLTATLRDSNGIPLPGKKIIWESASGNLDQTSGNTDRQGNVSVVYQASTAPQTVKITALFEGDTLYEKTCGMSTITIIKRPPPWWLWVIVVIAVGISIIIVLYHFGRFP